MKVFTALALGFSGLVLFSACTSPKTTATKPAAPATAEPAINYERVSYNGQLITDYEVGKVLGDIKCGKRPVRDGIDYLNVNGVPKALLENQTREVVRGFQSATTWC